MEIATIAIMIVAFIGMIVCAKKQKTNPNAKTIAILCLIVVVICAGKFMVDTGSFGGPSREMKEALASYDRFSEASAQAAGELVSQKFADKNVIVVASGGNSWDKQPNKLVDYVKKYITGATVTVKGLPYDVPENGGGMVEEYMNAKYFNDLFKENAGTDVYVMTLSLPYDPGQMQRLSVWTQKNGPKLVLINADVNYLGEQIQKGIIAGAVVMRPDLKQEDFEKNAPKDLKEAFAGRYILITPENLVEMAKKYPSLFNRR